MWYAHNQTYTAACPLLATVYHFILRQLTISDCEVVLSCTVMWIACVVSKFINQQLISVVCRCIIMCPSLPSCVYVPCHCMYAPSAVPMYEYPYIYPCSQMYSCRD